VKPLTILVVAMALAAGVAVARDDGEEPGAGEAVADLHQVTADTGIDAMPSWTPDGRRIVFHARHAPEKAGLLPTRKIWVVDREGHDAHKLSDGPADEYHPVVSPDGTKIVFVSEANGSRDIWVMDADGKNPLPLTDDPGLEEHPTWSPDGKQIAYVALPKEGGNFDLWIMNADGSGKRKLTSTPANEVFPAWQPSGRVIAFATDLNGNYDIYGISIGDEKTFPILTGPPNDTRPAWSLAG
jgi:TolB protein